TSTENSGLFDYMLPQFEQDTGIEVRVTAVGTGAALDMGRRCDTDALLVHAKQAELQYVDDGYGVERHDVMYNDFIIVRPASDPAGIGGMDDAAQALATIAQDEDVFLSRGDDSGTNKKELSLWDAAGVDPLPASGEWYRETGDGMGATLNTAQAMAGYTLTDRGTWISFKNKGELEVLVEGDERLFNQYGVMLINPERCPQASTAAAREFSDWLISDRGQDVIASYRLQGKQLFHPNADD